MIYTQWQHASQLTGFEKGAWAVVGCHVPLLWVILFLVIYSNYLFKQAITAASNADPFWSATSGGIWHYAVAYIVWNCWDRGFDGCQAWQIYGVCLCGNPGQGVSTIGEDHGFPQAGSILHHPNNVMEVVSATPHDYALTCTPKSWLLNILKTVWATKARDFPQDHTRIISYIHQT